MVLIDDYAAISHDGDFPDLPTFSTLSHTIKALRRRSEKPDDSSMLYVYMAHA